MGGRQTKGLALRGADGRDYTFRAIDKDPTDVLPADLRDTWARSLVQDQIAASQPAAFLVADELMEAAGILHAKTRLVVMPDDPRLGSFRQEFAATVGQISEYPRGRSGENPGFQGALEVLKHEDFYARLAAGTSDRPDARAFLKARLFDLMIGDWDRHRDQWRWARFADRPEWQPIPDDRDQAFSRYEGLVPGLARPRAPFLQSYAADYPDMKGLTWNGREQDRQLLAGLERKAYAEAAAELQARITDDGDREGRAADAPRVRRARRGSASAATCKAVATGWRTPRTPTTSTSRRRSKVHLTRRRRARRDRARDGQRHASCAPGRAGPTGSRSGEPIFEQDAPRQARRARSRSTSAAATTACRRRASPTGRWSA